MIISVVTKFGENHVNHFEIFSKNPKGGGGHFIQRFKGCFVHSPILLDMPFSFVLRVLSVLIMEDHFSSIPVFWGHVKYKIVLCYSTSGHFSPETTLSFDFRNTSWSNEFDKKEIPLHTENSAK